MKRQYFPTAAGTKKGNATASKIATAAAGLPVAATSGGSDGACRGRTRITKILFLTSEIYHNISVTFKNGGAMHLYKYNVLQNSVAFPLPIYIFNKNYNLFHILIYTCINAILSTV